MRDKFKIDGMFKNSFMEFSPSIPESKRAFGVRMVKWGMFLLFKHKQ